MGLIFIAEILNRAKHRIGGRSSQGAKRSILDALGKLVEHLYIAFFAVAPTYPSENLVHYPNTFTTGGAFPARFVFEELEEVPGYIDHAGIFIHDYQAAGPHDRTDFGELLIINRKTQTRSRDAAAGRPTCLNSFEFLVARDPTADIEHDLPQCNTHRNLNKPRILDLPDHGEHLCALAGLGSDAGEPLAALIEYLGHIGPRLNIVDICRSAPDPELGGGRARSGGEGGGVGAGAGP